jgi:hypothetical protein
MQGAVCEERGEELTKFKVLQNEKKDVLIPETDGSGQYHHAGQTTHAKSR